MRHTGHPSAAFNARKTLKDMCRHILILEVNNVLTDLGSRHPSVMQDQVPFLQVSVLKDGKMFFMPFFFFFSAVETETQRGCESHTNTSTVPRVHHLPVHTGEFSIAAVPG